MYPNGYFISFEGIDGTGKTTQLNMLAEALQKQGHDVLITKEPGDGKYGSQVGPGIRILLFKEPGTKNLGAGVGDVLFFADHLQNTHDIEKSLSEGKFVLTDRYADSQFAYAASETKRAPEWANQLFKDHFGPVPDLTLLFVVHGPLVKQQVGPSFFTREVEDISWALRRANARRGVEAGKQDGKAWNDVEEQRKIQNEYIRILSGQQRTCFVHIWEEYTPEQVHELVLGHVQPDLIATKAA